MKNLVILGAGTAGTTVANLGWDEVRFPHPIFDSSPEPRWSFGGPRQRAECADDLRKASILLTAGRARLDVGLGALDFGRGEKAVDEVVHPRG